MDFTRELSAQELLVIEGTDQREWTYLSPSNLDRLKEIQESVPVIDKPYTTILTAIMTDGCSLNMQSWHTCKTTHCLGGLTVIKAGDAGRELESRFDTETAVRAILRKSRPEAPLPNFYARNEAALAFIQVRAAEEVA